MESGQNGRAPMHGPDCSKEVVDLSRYIMEFSHLIIYYNTELSDCTTVESGQNGRSPMHGPNQ